MKFQYRVQGKVKSAFVVRGLLFQVGSNIDFCVSGIELDFVKLHCSEYKVTDLEAKEEKLLDPVLEVEPEAEANTEPKVEEKETKKESEKNELHTRPRSPKNGNTKKSQSKVSLPVRE